VSITPSPLRGLTEIGLLQDTNTISNAIIATIENVLAIFNFPLFFEIMFQINPPFAFRNTFKSLQAVTRIKHGHSSVFCRNLPTFLDTVSFAYVIAYSKKATFEFNHSLLLYNLPSSLPWTNK
jgi:hypothetical protein